MKHTLILTLLVLSTSFAWSGVPLDVKQLESDVKKTLQLKTVKADIKKLGADGARNVNMKFGKLKLAEFNRIHEYLKFPFHSQVPKAPYSPLKDYQLTDFLLPKMQAPLGKVFLSSEAAPWLAPLNGDEETVLEIMTNCWSTAYDILLSDKYPLTSFLYMHPDSEVIKQLRSSVNTKEVTQSELKPYDYILYLLKKENGTIEIDHVAVYLGMELAFEKTGYSELDFYQISPLSQITIQRKGLNSGDSRFAIEYRRLQAPLEHPYKVWGAKSLGLISEADLKKIPFPQVDQLTRIGTEGYGLIRPIEIQLSSMGGFEFNPQDPLTADFRVPPILGTLGELTHGYTSQALNKKSCKLVGALGVKVLQTVEPAYQVQALEMQMIDEEAKCIDSKGNAVLEFWVPMDSFHTNV